jgi:hypothetical protein
MHPWFKQQLMHLEVSRRKSTMIHPLESSSDFLQNLRLEMGSNINITELPEKRDRTITDWLKGMLQSPAPMALNASREKTLPPSTSIYNS